MCGQPTYPSTVVMAVMYIAASVSGIVSDTALSGEYFVSVLLEIYSFRYHLYQRCRDALYRRVRYGVPCIGSCVRLALHVENRDSNTGIRPRVGIREVLYIF